jgi:hypothetical protein
VRPIRKVPDKVKDSEQWKKAEAENRGRRDALAGAIVAARLCPFCLHKMALLSYGVYGPEMVKCPQCGEIVAFPPVIIDGTGEAVRSLIVREPTAARP